MQDQGYRRIPLRRRDGSVRAWALVDAADYERVNALRWSLHSAGYACRKRGTVYMHRLILDLAAGDEREVDHRNGDPLDNRRSNIRVVTHAQNLQNVAGGHGSSRYRGVCRDRGIWKAQAKVGGKHFNLGRFATEEEAARVAADFRADRMPFAEVR